MRKIIPLILLFCFAVSGFCADRSKDLIAWYKLDGNFNDSSGNNYNLTSLSPNNQFSPDGTVLPENNSCFGPVRGDTPKDKGGATGPALPLSNKNGFTICGFVTKPDTGNDYHSSDFGCGSPQHRRAAALFFSAWGTINTKVGDTIKKSYQRLDDNKWHHYAMVVPPENENNEYRVYIDGIEVYRSPIQWLSSYGNFVLGITEGKEAAGIKIDEVKVFNRALKQDEIQDEAKLKGTPQSASQIGLTVAKPGIGNAIDFVRRKKPKEINFPVKGAISVHFITSQWLCIVGDYNEFLCDRFKIECGDFLKRLDSGDIRVDKWSYDFHYNFAALEVISDYRPIIKRNFEDISNFQLSTGNGEPLQVIDNSYWINAVGQMRVPIISTGVLSQVNSAAVAHFAYLKLAEPLKNGTKYTVKTRPGIGRSWNFEIGGDAIGMAFYTHIRGLYHQRSGIKKGPPHTNWLMGADHMESWVGGFSPNSADYDTDENKGYGYTDENGKPVKVEHFDVIRETATNIKLPDVHGGWWDAGDYDRRSYHFRIVEDLLTAYFMFPEKFADKQLDIPESGNGIPDIIDEAAWGIEVWRSRHLAGS